MDQSIEGNVGVQLPGDMEEEILSRLSVKQLLQFKCVCKSWQALIENPGFITKHYQTQRSLSNIANAPLLLGGSYERYLLSKSIMGDVPLRLNLDDTPNHDVERCHFAKRSFCVGFTNGIACLNSHDNSYALWNPATRDFRALPIPIPRPDMQNYVLMEHDSYVYGFGFDPRSNDFKIMISTWLLYKDDSRETVYQLYSLSTDSWKIVDPPGLNECMGDQARSERCKDGFFYWHAQEYEKDGSYDLVILSFDLHKEVFFKSPSPVQYLNGVVPFRSSSIGIYNDSVALFVTYYKPSFKERSFEIWVVTESHEGVPLSWTRILIVGPLLAPTDMDILGVREDGNLLLLTCQKGRQTQFGGEHYDTSLYNPSSQTCRSLGLFVWFYSKYVESLFSLKRSS